MTVAETKKQCVVSPSPLLSANLAPKRSPNSKRSRSLLQDKSPGPSPFKGGPFLPARPGDRQWLPGLQFTPYRPPWLVRWLDMQQEWNAKCRADDDGGSLLYTKRRDGKVRRVMVDELDYIAAARGDTDT